jgi:ABC-type dipeptide/oligopeptide/nickel transport system permease component
MVGLPRGVRKPRLTMVVARALLVSLLGMILAFAISLLLGIAGLMIAAANKGGTVDMTFAYRHIAAPVALVVGPVVLVLSLAMELRHYRQAKALASIERAG